MPKNGISFPGRPDAALYGSDFPFSLWGGQTSRGKLSAIWSPVPECQGEGRVGIRRTDAGFCCLDGCCGG